ncbi:MAG TPA: preprotein translocase subunit SecE [Solirubrobacteraceae bacterium]|jgi:preprotein translocase SecE subunit
MAREPRRSRRRPRPDDAATPATPNDQVPLDEDLVREIGNEDDQTIDRGPLGEGTPAPDPLKHALPDVEIARLAEAGAGTDQSGEIVYDDGDDDGASKAEYAPAPDAVEGDQAVRRRDLDPSVAEETVARPRRQRGRVLAFLGHCVDELRRVQWPDRRQVFQATAVVLGFVVLAGGYLGLMDAIFKPLVQAIL